MNGRYEKEISLSKQALDIYGKVENFLLPSSELYDIMEEIEDDINMRPKEEYKELWDFMKEHYEVFHDDIFNCMSHYEFLDYCKERYPDKRWQEEVIERHWVI